jgi:phosphopantothenate-cysteine ligase
MAKPMKILVTAGDTYELIDDVRRITHMATGRLGCLIADEFARNGASVIFLCGERSIHPTLAMEKTVVIQGVISLENAVKDLLSETQFCGVVHSMAVSDYIIRGLASEDDIADELCKIIMSPNTANDEKLLHMQIKQAINNAMYNATGKISSDLASLAVFLNRAPKVISHVKQMQPDTVLVGFKLLSSVSEQELLQAAQKQMQSSGSDFVLANDLDAIEGDKHGSMLIGHDGILERLATKQDIAKSIVRHVTNRVMEQNKWTWLSV